MENYKGWSISFDMKPIPTRNFDWTAISPDFDADYDGDGFYISSGHQVHGASHEELLREIDAVIIDSGDEK